MSPSLTTGLLRRDRGVREAAEAQLAPAATRSTATRGRARPEPPDAYRTAFEVDRDRIIHSKAFRRLKYKTQVFLNPSGDHLVTRLTHALQVTQVARSLAAGLGLNEALAEAIALGHDIGHSPFGHVGEEALDPYVPGGWHHAAQSVRILSVLEDRNLCWEVLDGIRAHSWRIEPGPSTPEAVCVRLADRIAYLSHDAQDAVRAGVLTVDDFPAAVLEDFGPPSGAWVGAMITAVLDASAESGYVTVATDVMQLMGDLRSFMFERVYLAPSQRHQHEAAVGVIRRLVEHHLAHPGAIPASYRDERTDTLTQVVDYIAGMTDRYALDAYEHLVGERPAVLAGAG